jgi:hypothetical protein
MGLRPTYEHENVSVGNLSHLSHYPFLVVIPSVPGFPTSPLSPATTYVVLLKENHTELTEAATSDRKSGGVRDLRFPLPAANVGESSS